MSIFNDGDNRLIPDDSLLIPDDSLLRPALLMQNVFETNGVDTVVEANFGHVTAGVADELGDFVVSTKSSNENVRSAISLSPEGTEMVTIDEEIVGIGYSGDRQGLDDRKAEGRKLVVKGSVSADSYHNQQGEVVGFSTYFLTL